MQGDHYAVLGVGRDASEDAIQAAYRKLARQWHPDMNSDSDAAARFATVSQAYAILSHRVRRETYDRSLRSESVGPPPPIITQPIRCTECGEVTAQPRILVFRSTIGILVWNRIQRIEGVFCSRCARRSGVKASLITAIAGWWAAPLGPFFAAWCILANAVGGSRRPRADRRLALVNAQAFLERRHLDLAYALARDALDGRHGVDGSDARAAQSIIDQSRPRSAYLRPLVLKDPWRADMGYMAAHVLLLLAVPVAVATAVWLFITQ
jgi:curved DNA-binding protein CbpA